MDNDIFGLQSQLIVRDRTMAGAIHPAKMMADPAYAEAVFAKIEESDDASLVMLSLELRQKLGPLDSKPVAAAASPGKDEPPAEKYFMEHAVRPWSATPNS
jgi:hypothetical protein